jgi:hypothetical protein
MTQAASSIGDSVAKVMEVSQKYIATLENEVKVCKDLIEYQRRLIAELEAKGK